MKKNFYRFVILEHNGEQEYSFIQGCYSTTETEAKKIARKYAKEFYMDCRVKETRKNYFDFLDIGISVEMLWSGKCDYEEFKNELANNALVS